MAVGTTDGAVVSGDSVEVRYSGWLYEAATGTIAKTPFDSNLQRDKAFRFKVVA